jgi:hypothetical protein
MKPQPNRSKTTIKPRLYPIAWCVCIDYLFHFVLFQSDTKHCFWSVFCESFTSVESVQTFEDDEQIKETGGNFYLPNIYPFCRTWRDFAFHLATTAI